MKIERREIINKKIIGANPDLVFPIKGVKSLCFLKNVVKNPNVKIGEYTYYDDFENPLDFEKNILYHYDFLGDKLIIGKFCAIASGVRFIMNGANHKMNGFTTYPFAIFRNGWDEENFSLDDLPYKGDTIIGNDVWIGMDSLIMPGVKIGDGAIIASNSTVVKDVEPYSIVGGNPAKYIKKRFSNDIIDLLLKIKWWDFSHDKITKSLPIITGSDVDKLKTLL